MDARLLASERGFPEGPTVLPDGRLVFCDGNIGELSVYADGDVGTFAATGGSPWGAVLGSDGAIYVTQGGNVPGSGDTSAVSGIQRVQSDGTRTGPSRSSASSLTTTCPTAWRSPPTGARSCAQRSPRA